MVLTLDPVIHEAARLRILAILFRNRQASFTQLRDTLQLTSGNLASHAKRLVDARYVESGRVLAGVHFEVRFRITPLGSAAFHQYIEALRALVAPEVDLDAPAASTKTSPGTSA